jgi:hypothetical protein
MLGQVYEQFLGKVIRLTPAHRAEVDDKPEVKKAGGVFYTPTYIGEYIVQNTVGKLLDDCSRRGNEAEGIVFQRISASSRRRLRAKWNFETASRHFGWLRSS